MKKELYLYGTVLWVVILMFVCLIERPASAESCIPEEAIIVSAEFSISVMQNNSADVRIHRITAPWDELGVTWNNFGSNFDPSVEGIFTPNSGEQSVDVTSLVQQWIEGTPNHGLLLEQGPTDMATYKSSERYYNSLNNDRPKLEICYLVYTDTICVTIQRSGPEQDGVADAYIWEIAPNHNGGGATTLYTGLYADYNGEKQSLVKFEIETCRGSAGTGTPGYWKNHPEAWPVDEITIGGETYTKDEAIAYMWMPEKGDKTRTMFRGLVAAKLNVYIGTEESCITETISAADSWMETYGPVGEGVKGNSLEWGVGEPLYLLLDQYNNGDLCAPHRD